MKTTFSDFLKTCLNKCLRKPSFYLVFLLSLMLGYTLPFNFMLSQLTFNILVILMVGGLTAFAIVFAVMDSKVMEGFLELKEKEGKNYYQDYLEALKSDLNVLIVASVIFGIIIFIWNKDIPFIKNPFCEISKKNILAFIEYLFLFLSVSAFSDIVQSIFLLAKFKYMIYERKYIRNSEEQTPQTPEQQENKED